MVTAVVFDVGETLIDETRMWQQVAKDAGVPAFTLMGTLGGLITRGEHHQRVWELLERNPVPGDFSSEDFYPDALPCLRRLSEAGFFVGAVGNTSASTEELLRPHTSFVGSSARWGVEKPSSGFFARLIAECARPAADGTSAARLLEAPAWPSPGRGSWPRRRRMPAWRRAAHRCPSWSPDARL